MTKRLILVYTVVFAMLLGGTIFISLVLIPEEYRQGKAGMIKPHSTAAAPAKQNQTVRPANAN